MESFTGVPGVSLDGSEYQGAYAPGFGEVPLPDFLTRRRQASGVTFGPEPAVHSGSMTTQSASNSEELLYNIISFIIC